MPIVSMLFRCLLLAGFIFLSGCSGESAAPSQSAESIEFKALVPELYANLENGSKEDLQKALEEIAHAAESGKTVQVITAEGEGLDISAQLYRTVIEQRLELLE